MPLIKSTDAPSFSLPGVTFTGFASPSRGARETATWRVTLAPGTEGTPHSVDREEIFVIIEGSAVAIVDGQELALAAGDTLIVPASTPFSLANPSASPCTAIAVLPVGGRAALLGGEPFVPPWCA